MKDIASCRFEEDRLRVLVNMQRRELSHLWLLILTVALVSVSGFPTNLKKASVIDRNTSASPTKVNYSIILPAALIIA